VDRRWFRKPPAEAHDFEPDESTWREARSCRQIFHSLAAAKYPKPGEYNVRLNVDTFSQTFASFCVLRGCEIQRCPDLHDRGRQSAGTTGTDRSTGRFRRRAITMSGTKLKSCSRGRKVFRSGLARVFTWS